MAKRCQKDKSSSLSYCYHFAIRLLSVASRLKCKTIVRYRTNLSLCSRLLRFIVDCKRGELLYWHVLKGKVTFFWNSVCRLCLWHWSFLDFVYCYLNPFSGQKIHWSIDIFSCARVRALTWYDKFDRTPVTLWCCYQKH